ncbi:MAG: hypothetical protein PHS92_05420 [Candidatus Gracilibacteria bacterium]|nr:hypothetical protein [Candidatus Gracilibacteria bacterium]
MLNLFKEKTYKDEDTRLRYYKELNERSPLFSIPEQKEQIGELKKSIGNLNKIQSLNKSKIDVPKIFPTLFLKEYTLLIEKQSDFFNNPNFKNALKLQEQLEKTNKYYMSEAKDIREGLKIFFSEKVKDNREFQFFGSHSNHDILIGDMDLIIKNSEAMSELIKNRKKCLEISAKYCMNENGINDIKLYDQNSNDFSKPENKENTWIYMDNGCFGETKNEIYVFHKKCPSFFDFCELETDFYKSKFYKSLPLTSKNEFYIDLIRKGVRAVPNNLTTQYSCTDNSYIALGGNLDYFLNFLKIQKNPFNNEESELLANNGSDLFSLKSLSQKYRIGLDFKKYRLLSGNLMNNYLVYNNSIYHDINNVVNADLSKTEKSDTKINYVNYEYTVMTRINYSIYFLTYSPFTWKIKERPIFSLKKGYRKNPNYYNEDEAIRLYGKDYLNLWEKQFHDTSKSDFYSKYYKGLGF